MAEANTYSEGLRVDYTPVAAVSAGEVVHLADGRAAVATTAIAAGVKGSVAVSGIYQVAKTSNVVLLDGMEIWWDASAGSATYWHGNDEDFILGTLVGDAASSDTTCYVNLNGRCLPIIDIQRDGGATVPVLTAGTPYVISRGGSLALGFSATAEAQKVDWLSQRSFPIASDWIAEFVFAITTDADADVADLSLGVASGTHATDFESVAEFVVIHQDMGADANVDVDSDDTSTDVGIQDSTIDRVVGTPIHVMLDGRTPTDVQVYINGVLVLGSTVFTLAAATGPLKLVAHLEKTSNDSPGEVRIDKAIVRTMDL